MTNPSSWTKVVGAYQADPQYRARAVVQVQEGAMVIMVQHIQTPEGLVEVAAVAVVVVEGEKPP